MSKIESIKPVAWSGTRQVALVPQSESPWVEFRFNFIMTLNEIQILARTESTSELRQ